MSEKKLSANRQNAQRSTGPQTPDGKRAASQNAVTHGLLSQEVLLPGEDGDALNALRAALIAERTPVGAVETMWVDIAVASLWKLRRINRLERGTFVFHQNESSEHARLFPTTRHLTATEHLAVVLIADTNNGDQLGKLARYEAMHERTLVRALHELERLQAARRGVPVAPPTAVDVLVTAPDIPGSLPSGDVPVAHAAPAGGGAPGEPGAEPVLAKPFAAVVDPAAGGAVRNEPTAPVGGAPAPDVVRNEPTGTA